MYPSSIALTCFKKNLGSLKQLKILALQSNRVTKLEGLAELVNLQELYLSHNGIKKLEGLEHNVGKPNLPPFPLLKEISCIQVKLKTLDLGCNFVSKLENLAHLTSLEELWVCLGGQLPCLISYFGIDERQ
jgi:protein phosphatase 1 regulatory subunit 7